MTSSISETMIGGLTSKLTTMQTAIDGKPSTADVAAAVAAVVTGLDVGDYAWSARAAKTKWLLCDGAAYSRTTYAALFAVLGTRYGAGDGSTTFNVPKSGGRTLVAAGTGTDAEAFAAASVNATTDVITVASNVDKWITGKKVRATTTTTLPGGLAINTDYFVMRLTATTIQLASSLANAIAGTAINITSAGTGTHTITHTLVARALGEQGGEETHSLTTTEIPAHTHNYTTLGGSGGVDYAVAGSQSAASTAASASTGGSGAHNIMQPYQIENLFIYAGV